MRRPRATTEAPGIDYRHLIDSLLKKPGAFRRYVHHASLFPDVCFRQAYETLKAHDEARADRRYLQLLKLAAEGSETDVSEAIGNLLRENKVPLPDRIEKLLALKARRSVPVAQHMEPLQPALQGYDLLIGMVQP